MPATKYGLFGQDNAAVTFLYHPYLVAGTFLSLLSLAHGSPVARPTAGGAVFALASTRPRRLALIAASPRMELP